MLITEAISHWLMYEPTLLALARSLSSFATTGSSNIL